MFEKLLKPLEPYALTILRVMLGITFLWHGLAKLSGPDGFIGWVGSMGVPAPMILGWFVILLEAVGGLMMILGVGVRPVGLLLAVLMLTTTLLVKSSIGFIAEQGAGAELDLMLLVSALTVAILGPGRLAVENLIFQRAQTGERRTA